ncbi:MAG: DNA polymerase III subunit delta [Planctomycetota bacterium]
MARKMPAKSVALDANVRVLAVHGPEDAIKKEKIDQLRVALEKEHGEVQRITFDGKTAALAEVFDEVRGYSLMGGYKLVTVDPADDFVKANREPLERYAQHPVDHATLVLRAVGWNRGNLDKHIAKVGAVIKCEPPKPAEAVSRLVARAKNVHGLSIDRPAAQLMVDRLGVHLVRLETELDKLAAMAGALSPKGRSMKAAGGIDRAMVEQAVGKSSDEKAWEVQESILSAMAAAGSRGPGRGGGGGSAGISGGGGGAMVTKVRELIDLGGQPEVLVTYFVADLARKLAVGGQMLAAGEPEGGIAKALKLWGPRQRLFMQVLRDVGPDGGAAMLDLALTADARSKSGFGPAGRNLEGLCIQMADVRR